MKLNLTEKRINKNLDLLEILTHLQTAAVTHAIQLGFGFEEMLEKDMFWVVLRTKFKVLNNEPSDTIDIKTYPKINTRITFDREYILSHNNNVLVQGISRWSIISASQRRFVRTPIQFPGEFVEESIFDEFDKINIQIDNFKLVDNYIVKKEDLDDLNHLNNVNYAKMINKVYTINNIKEFQIDYLNEILLDQQVDLYMYKDEAVYILGVVNEKNCFIAKIKE